MDVRYIKKMKFTYSRHVAFALRVTRSINSSVDKGVMGLSDHGCCIYIRAKEYVAKVFLLCIAHDYIIEYRIIAS